MTAVDDTIKKNLVAQESQTRHLESSSESIDQSLGKQEGDIEGLRARSQALREAIQAKGISVPEPSRRSGRSQKQSAQESAEPIEPSYEEITAANLAYLERNGLADREFDDLFSREQLLAIERELSAPLARERWDRWDFCAVLAGGIAGVAADFFSGGIDKKLKNWLGEYKISSPQVATDYQGPGFGGPWHRGLSPGHDILRVFEAVWQIKNGTFRGFKKISGGFEWITSTMTPDGTPFQTCDGALGLEAILVWVKHLASDFVTPTSLPFPGMSYLMQMPNVQVHKFAIQLYQSGYNLRLILVQALAPALVEIVVRGYLYGRQFINTGTIKMSTERKQKLTEMLLTAHALVMAVNVGKVVVRCHAEGPLALRALNVPAIMMTIRYFIPFVIARLKANDPVEILKRNAREINAGYDTLIAEMAEELRRDREFNRFLTSGNPITI